MKIRTVPSLIILILTFRDSKVYAATTAWLVATLVANESIIVAVATVTAQQATARKLNLAVGARPGFPMGTTTR
jgi:hypothetical protein